MDKSTNEHIAILAYGSLIWEPGEEIKQHIIAVVDCITPFNVEYAQRSYKSRGGAPTLTKISGIGNKTRAKLLVLDYHNTIEGKKKVYSLICQRENTPKKEWNDEAEPPKPIYITNLEDYDSVFYCAFKGEPENTITSENLVNWAKESVIACNKEGKIENNGVRYLINCYKNGVVTPLTEEYIQKLGGTNVEEIEKRILKEEENDR
ncbi:MAG: hypothetical protein KKA79_06755 [Nanoarchaeota archaeon]|nr:hypothetical protein [Nanoarchaeota archaeon]